jgi:hypothetical protein
MVMNSICENVSAEPKEYDIPQSTCGDIVDQPLTNTWVHLEQFLIGPYIRAASTQHQRHDERIVKYGGCDLDDSKCRIYVRYFECSSLVLSSSLQALPSQ